MKPHNLTKLTIFPDADGNTFHFEAVTENGGSFTMSGPFAVSTFIEMTEAVVSCYMVGDDEHGETIH